MNSVKGAAFVAAMVLLELVMVGCDAAKEAASPLQPPPVLVTEPAPQKPEERPEAAPAKPTPSPTPAPKPGAPSGGTIRDLVAGSGCLKRRWSDHGPLFIGAVHGIAVSYAREVCAGHQPTKPGPRDGLAHYGLAGGDELLKTYALMFGLVVRESDGRHCVGLDTTNPASGDAETTEAGAFQVSYNSRNYARADMSCCTYNDPRLVGLFREAKTWGKDRCDLPEWREGMLERFGECSAANWLNRGSGEGKEFQRLMKECPAFAAEYAALALRIEYRNWGPIKTKAAVYAPECEQLLVQVKDLVSSDRSRCP